MAGLAWWHVVITVILLAVVGSVVYSVFIRKNTREVRGDERPYPVVLARFWAHIAIFGFSLGGLSHLSNALFSADVRVEGVPFGRYWPQLPAGMAFTTPPVEDTAAVLREGSLQSGEILVGGLDWGSRISLAGGELLIAIACITVAVLISRACTGILRGNPFTPRLRLWAWWSAMVVLVTGFVGQILKFTGQARAANTSLPWWELDEKATPGLREALEKYYAADENGQMPTLPDGPHFGGGSISLTPLWVAIIIIVVVELLNAGVKLAADKARLARDVEGLV